MLKNCLPNTAKLAGVMPIHVCVDQVVDVVMNRYEIAVALRDHASRVKDYDPLRKAGLHPAPKSRQ